MHTRAIWGRLALVLLAVTAVAACSGVRPYENPRERNLAINVVTDPGSLFGGVDAAVDIYSVDDRCQPEYLGTVALQDPLVLVGLPPDRLSYLVFTFSSSAYLGSIRGSAAFEVLMAAKAGYRYEAEVRYIDDIYNVEILEKSPGARRGVEIPLRDLASCN
ncbi:hypothetical protein SAMN04487965_2956 [Microbulbifer donghaiensis]|uniref:Lipoprotein n=1 Tax=Microbulbifer donghaiensis TaxID=494016 RepID=A0A1M5FKP6_9GAMM|nr:hypothetical protein [Microbulbifer donghaiensis]SHF92073.1 hypothetical protein SAMN04487965_2956 [Microbulbifer donghaiensis]